MELYESYKGSYYKKVHPGQFEFDPNEDESYFYKKETWVDFWERNHQQFTSTKNKLKEKSGDHFYNDNLNKITAELLGHNHEWGIGICSLGLHLLHSELHDVIVGFKQREIKPELKKELPNLFYDKRVERLFVALEGHGFFPTQDYKTANDKINPEDCKMLKEAYSDFKNRMNIFSNNNNPISKSSNVANTILFNDLVDLHIKLFQEEPSVSKSNFGIYTGKSKIFFESIFHLLNMNPIYSKTDESNECSSEEKVVPTMDSLIYFLKDRRKKI